MYKILLVDDEILVREAIRDKVAWPELGFELAGICENGKEAIAFIEQHPVDLVLTDIYMPYVDGLELCKYIYDRQLPIAAVIFSGYGDFEYAQKAIKYQVSEYLLKPVTARELSEVLLKMREKFDQERHQEQVMGQLTKAYHSYTKNESLIVSKILSSLMKGNSNPQQATRELQEFGVSLHARAYRIAVLDIDIYSGFYAVSEELKKESALMAFVVENIAGELMERGKAGLAFQDSDGRTYLLFRTNRVKEELAQVKTICADIQQTIYDATALSISIGIGLCVDSLAQLESSYNAAAAVLRFRFTRGNGHIFDSEETLQAASSQGFDELLKLIETALRAGEPDRCEAALNQVENWMRNSNLKKAAATGYLLQILRSIYEAVSERNPEFGLADADVNAVSESRNLAEAMQALRTFTAKALQEAAITMTSSRERKSLMAMDFLNENYRNPGLSLNDVCDYLQISISHFSTIFKEETGKTFTEALMSIRMERAKQLLRETQLKNYEIAEKVGFSDPHYFTIAFKKMTGMTPKKYARESTES